jgi:hypothetical protein
MDDENSQIKIRLVDVLNSILCPVVGCWALRGGYSDYYFDSDAESHVLEVWPIAIEPPEEHMGNGYPPTDQGLVVRVGRVRFHGVGEGDSTGSLPFQPTPFALRDRLGGRWSAIGVAGPSRGRRSGRRSLTNDRACKGKRKFAKCSGRKRL